MATNIVRKPGQQIEIVPTDPVLPVSGATIQYGNETGIALTSAAAPGAAVTCDLGPFEADLLVTDTGAAGIAAGAILWRHPGGLLDNVPAADGVYFGRARAVVGAGLAAIIPVYHDGAPGASGVIGAGAVGTAQLAANGVTATKLSAAARTRVSVCSFGADVAATRAQAVFVAPTDGVITGVSLVALTGIAIDGTKAKIWEFEIENQTGPVVAATATTETDAIVAATPLDFDLSVAPGALDIAAGDVLVLTATKTGAVADLEGLAIAITYQVKE
jgi:predicted RecA/RadA family phage recombinase